MTQLITKYRPDSFDDVYGQEDVIRSLGGVVREGLSSTFLFTGPSGCGKTTLARIVASEVGVEDKNVIEVDAATNSGVDSVRELTKPLAFKMGRHKRALVIDECHSLSNQAWQALLKIIEEPPAGVYFFFCTTEAQKVPKTIKTRCLVYELGLVSEDDLYEMLTSICEAEGYETSAEVLHLLADEAQGSPRQAISYLAKSHDCDSPKEAAVIINTASATPETINLCRVLISNNSTLEKALSIVKKGSLDSMNAESVKQIVLAYFTKVAMSDKRRREKALNVLRAFSTPYPPSAKGWPLLLSLDEFYDYESIDYAE